MFASSRQLTLKICTAGAKLLEMLNISSSFNLGSTRLPCAKTLPEAVFQSYLSEKGLSELLLLKISISVRLMLQKLNLETASKFLLQCAPTQLHSTVSTEDFPFDGE